MLFVCINTNAFSSIMKDAPIVQNDSSSGHDLEILVIDILANDTDSENYGIVDSEK